MEVLNVASTAVVFIAQIGMRYLWTLLFAMAGWVAFKEIVGWFRREP